MIWLGFKWRSVWAEGGDCSSVRAEMRPMGKGRGGRGISSAEPPSCSASRMEDQMYGAEGREYTPRRKAGGGPAEAEPSYHFRSFVLL